MLLKKLFKEKQGQRKRIRILRCKNCKEKSILTYKVEYDIILL